MRWESDSDGDEIFIKEQQTPKAKQARGTTTTTTNQMAATKAPPPMQQQPTKKRQKSRAELATEEAAWDAILAQMMRNINIL